MVSTIVGMVGMNSSVLLVKALQILFLILLLIFFFLFFFKCTFVRAQIAAYSYSFESHFVSLLYESI